MDAEELSASPVSRHRRSSMANTLIPASERNLPPHDIEAIDRRRQWGLTLQVIAGQFTFFAILLTLWSGQDLTYSPGWVRPMFYYNALCFIVAVVLGLYGSYLKRGSQEY
jgi:hypothetical protein